MSNIVEKTVNSLQTYVGKNILGGNFYLQEVLSEIASAPSKEVRFCYDVLLSLRITSGAPATLVEPVRCITRTFFQGRR